MCGGGWALERSIGKTACGLDGGEEETGREGETDGLTALSRNGSLLKSGHYVRGEARHCRSGAVCGGCSEAESRHCLRQQPERLPPGRPEGFSVLTRSTDRSVSEDRTEAAVLKGLEELRPGITKP